MCEILSGVDLSCLNAVVNWNLSGVRQIVKDRDKSECDGHDCFGEGFPVSQGSNAGVKGEEKNALQPRILTASISVVERILLVAKFRRTHGGGPRRFTESTWVSADLNPGLAFRTSGTRQNSPHGLLFGCWVELLCCGN